MGIEISVRGGLIGIFIIIWILGKAIRSIPSLYKESRSKKGSDLYGDLTALLGFRIIGILVFLGVLIWIRSKLGYNFDAISDITYAVFIALFVAGFCSFFVLITTFLLAKLSKVQNTTKEVDILDDERNKN